MQSYYNRKTKAKKFEMGDLVLREREKYGKDSQAPKMETDWVELYFITKAKDENNTVEIRLTLGDKPIRINIDKLKHFFQRPIIEPKPAYTGEYVGKSNEEEVTHAANKDERKETSTDSSVLDNMNSTQLTKEIQAKFTPSPIKPEPPKKPKEKVPFQTRTRSIKKKVLETL